MGDRHKGSRSLDLKFGNLLDRIIRRAGPMLLVTGSSMVILIASAANWRRAWWAAQRQIGPSDLIADSVMGLLATAIFLTGVLLGSLLAASGLWRKTRTAA